MAKRRRKGKCRVLPFTYSHQHHSCAHITIVSVQSVLITFAHSVPPLLYSSTSFTSISPPSPIYPLLTIVITFTSTSTFTSPPLHLYLTRARSL
mmetsp:Transcript_15180/g.38349  ORF Transcript_15180/g.38349 Transcript_15180/m.38349 type:complete len:94 (+) Transcript_15180:457-738(+)